MNNNLQQLLLGNVTFQRFEVPETLPNLFGVQKYAIHDFPGGGPGSRTIQELGAFAFPDIEWRGEFWDNDPTVGTTAVQRASQLNTYRVSGEVINLTWGPFQMTAVVCEFEVIGMLKQRLGYRIKIIPADDMTTTSNTAAPAANPAVTVTTANTAVANSTISTTTGYEFSTDVVSQSQTITGNVTQAVTNASGNIANIPPSTVTMIQGQISVLQGTLDPLSNSTTDFAGAAAANTLTGNLSALSNSLSSTPPIVSTISVSNPNLAVLAAQYYGDASLWPLIAQANNLQDMQLTGTYQLTIPPSTTQSAFIPVA